MDRKKVSVIIPAYNMAKFLGEAIRGVLNQTYPNLELIIVDDASTDNTREVVSQFDDPRITYLRHAENRYAAAARNTGIRASQGELIAFLDADDLIHPEKLQTQVEFLQNNPDTGLNYCSRIEIDTHGNYLTLVSAPPLVNLSDLVLGFPFAPSEVVMHREWAYRVGLFDESFLFPGEDPDFFMRLALHGCKMAGVKQILNYRRLRSERFIKNIPQVLNGELSAFENTFSHPKCPTPVRDLRSKSLAMLYKIFSTLAFVQADTHYGQELLIKSIAKDPHYYEIGSEQYIEYLVRTSVRNGDEHETPLRNIFQQLPVELNWVKQHEDSAVAFGYLLRWARDFIWGNLDQGVSHFRKAINLGSSPGPGFDRSLIQFVTNQLMICEAEFDTPTQTTLTRLTKFMVDHNQAALARQLRANYWKNRAIQNFNSQKSSRLIPFMINAIAADPTYLMNRGALSMLYRSTISRLKDISWKQDS